jgi:hypothetical protein
LRFTARNAVFVRRTNARCRGSPGGRAPDRLREKKSLEIIFKRGAARRIRIGSERATESRSRRQRSDGFRSVPTANACVGAKRTRQLLVIVVLCFAEPCTVLNARTELSSFFPLAVSTVRTHRLYFCRTFFFFFGFRQNGWARIARVSFVTARLSIVTYRIMCFENEQCNALRFDRRRARAMRSKRPILYGRGIPRRVPDTCGVRTEFVSVPIRCAENLWILLVARVRPRIRSTVSFHVRKRPTFVRRPVRPRAYNSYIVDHGIFVLLLSPPPSPPLKSRSIPL